MARPGRKFAGRRLAASHGSSPCDMGVAEKLGFRNLWRVRGSRWVARTFLRVGFCGEFRRGGGAMEDGALVFRGEGKEERCACR
jgi:hypothetical protein